MKFSRRAFTILELMLVICIIAILLTIVIASVNGTVKRARAQQTNALCNLAQHAIITYHAQKGKWPWGTSENLNDGYGRHELTAAEVRKCFYNIIAETHENNNPMMDISGLFVSTFPGEAGQRHYGMDFMTAVKGSQKNPKKYKVSQLYFGYPETETGYFRRYRVIYIPVLDTVQVTTQ